MIPSSLSGFVSAFFRLVGSTVLTPPHEPVVLFGLEGAIGGLGDFRADEAGEQAIDAEAYGALGVIVRPRTKETLDGKEFVAEGFGVRTPAGLVPLAYRDLRLNRRFPNPKPGTVALVGYGGGFLAFDDAAGDAAGDASHATFYVPYERNAAGAVTKAHMISVGKDGTGKPMLALISGEGPRVTLLGDEVVAANKNGSARVEVTNDGVNAVGPFKAASGADLGGPTSVALAKYPELAALMTPLMSLLSAITSHLSAPGALSGTPGAYATPLAAVGTAATAISTTGATLFTKGA